MYVRACVYVCLHPAPPPPHQPPGATPPRHCGVRGCVRLRGIEGADITVSLSAAGSDWSWARGHESNIVLNCDLLSSDPRARCMRARASGCVCLNRARAFVCSGPRLCGSSGKSCPCAYAVRKPLCARFFHCYLRRLQCVFHSRRCVEMRQREKSNPP